MSYSPAGPESKGNLQQETKKENALIKLVGTLFNTILNSNVDNRMPSFRQVKARLPGGTSFTEAEEAYAQAKRKYTDEQFRIREQELLPVIKAESKAEEVRRAKAITEMKAEDRREDDGVSLQSPMGNFDNGSKGRKILPTPGPDGWPDSNIDSDVV